MIKHRSSFIFILLLGIFTSSLSAEDIPNSPQPTEEAAATESHDTEPQEDTSLTDIVFVDNDTETLSIPEDGRFSIIEERPEEQAETTSAASKITLIEDPALTATENDQAAKTPHQQISPEEAEQLNKLYSIWKTTLDTLISNAQHLSQLVATQKINPTDRYAAFEWLQKFAMLAGKTTKLPYAPLTPNKLISFFTFNKMLINALGIAFTNNFSIKPHVEQLEEALHDLERSLQATVRTNLPISIAENYAIETGMAVQTLTNRICNSGLTWYNHLYRTILSIDRRLAISRLTKFTLSAATFGTALLYILPLAKRGYNYGWFQNLKEYLDDESKGGTFQKYGDHTQDEYKRLQLLFTAITAMGTLQQFGVFAKIEQLWTELDAFLKGSSVDMSHHFIQFIDDFTLEDPMFDSVRHLFDPFNKILRFMADPDLYIRSGQKVPKCLLLTGAPGSGKSHSVLALAGSINQLLLALGRPEKVGLIMVEPWDLAQIEDIIKQAQANAPCVIFIDEFHLFGGGAQISSNAIFLSKLLTELDRIEKNNDPLSQIFIIAATNRPDLIAKALLRHGRFGKDAQIRFPMPDFAQRKAVITTLAQKSAVDLSVDEINHLALITQGTSYSAISKIFEHAGFKAKERAEGITYEHLYQAVNAVIRVLNERISLTEKEKNIIAYHIAGAALALMLIENNMTLDAITLRMPAKEINEGHDFLAKMENQDEDQQYKMESSYGVLYAYNNYECVMPDTFETDTDAIKIILAGSACQQFIFGKISSYHKDDRQKAYAEAQKTILNGLTMNELSKDKQNQIKNDALALIQKAEAELYELFNNNRESLDRIARELKEKTFLTQAEIKQIIAA